MKLSIKKPCQENYQEFTSTTSGGFCQSCQQEVIDFTEMTDAQILAYFSNKQTPTCGRFNPSQLKSYPETISPKPTWNKKLIRASLLSLSLFTVLPYSPSYAQLEKVQTSFFASPKDKPEKEPEKEKKEQEPRPTRERFDVEGAVFGPEGHPLQGVAVLMKGQSIGQYTNEQGKFYLSNLQAGNSIFFHYVGFKMVEYVVPQPSTPTQTFKFNLHLAEDDLFLMGEVAIDRPYTSRPSLWQRVKEVFR